MLLLNLSRWDQLLPGRNSVKARNKTLGGNVSEGPEHGRQFGPGR